MRERSTFFTKNTPPPFHLLPTGVLLARVIRTRSSYEPKSGAVDHIRNFDVTRRRTRTFTDFGFVAKISRYFVDRLSPALPTSRCDVLPAGGCAGYRRSGRVGRRTEGQVGGRRAGLVAQHVPPRSAVHRGRQHGRRRRHTVSSAAVKRQASRTRPYPLHQTGERRAAAIQVYIGSNDVTESMATIRAPFCGYNLA